MDMVKEFAAILKIGQEHNQNIIGIKNIRLADTYDHYVVEFIEEVYQNDPVSFVDYGITLNKVSEVVRQLENPQRNYPII